MHEEKDTIRKKAAAWAAVGGVLTAATIMSTAPALTKKAEAAEPTKKPNILVIFGDDIGQSNISAYTHGLVGYQTPNVDRIAKEGLMFTDYYAENSCTAGRATFITGQSCFRTGLTKVGFLPTNHGFDEFFGNLYHLNAEEEPERPYWMSNNPAFIKFYNPRGVIHSFADGKVQDTGPLNKKRMETIDDETTTACMDFIDRQVKAKKPFFVWMNFTRMHIFTHVRESYRGKGGLGPGNEYADGMWEMDQNVGKLLKQLDDLGIAKDTIVVFSTDNGPNFFTWPDAASSPFRSEKDSNWEGAFRVPAMVRWPGHIKPGEITNGMFSGLDWFPTLLAAAGDTTIKERLLKGTQIGNKTFKVHLDGYNQLPLLTGQTTKSARDEYYYFDDDGELVAMRFDVLLPGATAPTAWKLVFGEQKAKGGLPIWMEPFDVLRLPKVYNLRMDPYERGDIGPTNSYYAWETNNVYLTAEGVRRASIFLKTFVEYPPSQSSASFSIDKAVEQLKMELQKKQPK
jgi:arylsulfatase A-like enzyme